MSSLPQFLSDLRSLGVLLSVEGERLLCNAPKGVLTPALREQLAERKPEILRFLGESARESSGTGVPGEELPLSRAQQRLWIFAQMNADNPVYNVPTALQLTGQMDQDALEKALHYLVGRHEALRTSFHERGGTPFARIAANPPFFVQTVDFRQRSQDAESVREVLLREARRPFPLEQAPLFRAVVLRLEERQSLLLLVAHHIVADGWSLGVLARELGASYTAFATGQTPALPPLAIQYRDFVLWEQGAGEQLAREHLPYWLEQLRGPLPVMELPTDRRRPVLQSFDGRRLALHLDAALGAEIRELARRTGTTAFILTLAAFNVLLHRYTGLNDVLVGSGTSNRHKQEFSPLVGFFVNTLVLRTDLSGDPTFLEFLERVRKTAHAAYAHQDVSFNMLLEELQPERSVNQSPLVQVAFTMQNVPMEAIALPGLDAEAVPLDAGIARLDLSVEVWPEGEGFRCDFEFNHNLFDEGTIRSLQAQYKTLLSAAVADPLQGLHALPLLSPEERSAILRTGKGTSTEYPRLPVPQVFATWAHAAPQALALRSKAGDTSYAELDRMSNAVAHSLAELRLPPHSFVAVAAEGSPLAIVAFLGVLKAGHAYMPVPTAQPAARIGRMMERAGIEVLLHLAEDAGRFAGLSLRHQRALEEFDGTGAPEPPEVAIGLDDPAYLMFTSGSTGEPKGVIVPHRGIVRLVCGVDYVHLSPAVTVGQIASLGFDASTWEIWAALLNGGTLAVVGVEQRDAEGIAAAIQRFGITAVLLTTALFHYMVERCPEGLSPLRQILAGGDVLSIAHVRRLLAVAPDVYLANAYGPTENTTITTCQPVTPHTLERGSVPIGRPINNTRVYILDKDRQPVPPGVPGELFAGGDGLALGYLENPDETARRFSMLEFDDQPGERVYATGDVARFLGDGAIEFLGRADQQIKLRGYRIELEEIQQVLLAIPGVQAAVVAVRAGPEEEQRLAAYVVPQPGAALDAQQLRVAARKILPEYEVPTIFLLLDEIPRTSNDKIDHLALADLPVPAVGGPTLGRPPSTPAELLLTSILAELLHVPFVSMNDDFFALGGHSLTVKQLISRVQAETGVLLPVASVFQNPSVDHLARELTLLLQAAPPSRGAGEAAPLEHPMSRSQRRLWFLDQLDPGNPAYNMAVALELRGDLDVEAFRKAMHFLVERHEALRTVFVQGSNGESLARVQDGRNWTLSNGTLPASGVQDRGELLPFLQTQADIPFQLDKGPLFRVTLYQVAEREHVALLAMHHIIADGWSVGVLARELGIVYEAFLHGRPVPLPPMQHPFRDFVSWESRELAASEEGDARYWREQLTGELPVLELPTDLPRPAVQTFRGARLITPVSRGLVERLERMARGENVTLFMVLIAAFDVLLLQYTGATDLLVGTPTAGRRNADFESTFGFFVNNLVLRSDLSGNPTVRELIQRVGRVTMDAFEHQGTPFDRLVEMLQPERRLDRSAVFQVMFTLQNSPLAPLRLGPLEIKSLDMQHGRARYEIATEFYPFEGNYRLDFEYNTDLFQEDAVIRMQTHFLYLLEAMAADPLQTIGDLPLLNEAERDQILHEWNRTPPVAPEAPSVAAWFRAQARATPANIAVAMGEASLTYAELDRASDRVAVALQAGGVGPNGVVGLYFQRGPALVISLLAILKAGGTYLPLDPALPARRLSYMLEDSGVATVLTEEALQEQLGLPPDRVLLFENIASDSSAGQAAVPVNAATADDLAFMIYTSGSTGNPKGTAIPGSALLNLLASILDTPGLAENDTLVAVSTISFDIASLEVLGPLLRGARLVLASAEEVLDPDALGALVDRVGATVMQATPATWRMLVESGWMGRPDLRMWCGGEALTPTLAEALLARGRELWNMYGPTETTIYSTRQRVRSGEEPILIGKPVSGTRVYILNERQQPVAAGVPGELYIAGTGLARGYWRQPELTAERFLPDPFSAEGGRMYRTGDIARFRPGGAIQLLGRADQQVKLRGYRIELGEIEAALERHPAILQAVVLSAGEESARHLVAHLLEEEPGRAGSDDLRLWLRERLPEYMIPSRFVPLETLPLTPSGKVDRRRLAAEQPSVRKEERAAALVRPRSEMEARVAKVWTGVLGVESIDVRDNFFDLGGHSLLLVRVHAQLRAEFGTELSIVDLFRYSTVEALAARLSQTQQPALAGGARA